MTGVGFIKKASITTNSSSEFFPGTALFFSAEGGGTAARQVKKGAGVFIYLYIFFIYLSLHKVLYLGRSSLKFCRFGCANTQSLKQYIDFHYVKKIKGK